ncbi:MAG TPA: hypothetical protein VFX80_11700, partial [Solirubrobacteraceae bacterium]|nr:hypothetical protein [Solirubrobacteraceae bacterium]
AYGVSPTRREFRVPDLDARHTHGVTPSPHDHSHRHAWTEAVPSHRHSVAGHDHPVYVHLYAPAPRYVVKV